MPATVGPMIDVTQVKVNGNDTAMDIGAIMTRNDWVSKFIQITSQLTKSTRTDRTARTKQLLDLKY